MPIFDKSWRINPKINLIYSVKMPNNTELNRLISIKILWLAKNHRINIHSPQIYGNQQYCETSMTIWMKLPKVIKLYSCFQLQKISKYMRNWWSYRQSQSESITFLGTSNSIYCTSSSSSIKFLYAFAIINCSFSSFKALINGYTAYLGLIFSGPCCLQQLSTKFNMAQDVSK